MIRKNQITGTKTYECKRCRKTVPFILRQPLSHVASKDRQKLYRIAECPNCGWKGWTSYQK